MAWLMFLFSYIAACFLLRTLINRKKLDKRNYRIQLISEVVWIVVFVVVGIYLW
jgi:hypothetical protein